MSRFRKYFTRKRLVVLILFSIFISFSVIDSRFLYTGFSPTTGGVWFTSTIYNAKEGNETYTIQFLGVNFTFLYLTYPGEDVVDAPYTIYINVSFQDGVSEILSISIEGYLGLFEGDLISIPYGQRTVHSFPAAAVLTSKAAGYWGWQYAVSFII